MFYRISIMSVLLLLVCSLLYGQSSYGTYMKMDYLHIDYEEHHEFMEDILSDLKSLKEDRIEQGKIVSWKIYSVVYPGEQAKPYNYVSVTLSNDIDAFEYQTRSREDHLLAESIKHKYGIVRSEMWRVRNSVKHPELEEPSIYVMMDYMHVTLGREFEYQMLEDEVVRPLHEDRMENEIMDAWEMYELLMPGGKTYGYNFLTGNYFNALSHIEFGLNEELIHQHNPNINMMELFDNIWATRDLVQSEVWRLVTFSQ